MREIKFRALKKNSYEIVYFDLKEFLENDDNEMPNAMQFVLSNIMQFTGLQDKNGVDIYEGDILEFDGGNQLAVLFEGGSFGCVDHYLNFLSFCDWNMLIAEVVCNIYENKI